MMLFAIRIEHPFDIPVQRPENTHPRMHQRPTAFSSHDQRLGCCLPFAGVLLDLWQLYDIGSGVLEGDELAALGQRDWGFEWALPATIANGASPCRRIRS
jgi:hypothetical protein